MFGSDGYGSGLRYPSFMASGPTPASAGSSAGASSQRASQAFSAAPPYTATPPPAAAGASLASPGGSRKVPYQKTWASDGEDTATATAKKGNFATITAMSHYLHISLEELRFEDYCAGVRSGPPKSPSSSGTTMPTPSTPLHTTGPTTLGSTMAAFAQRYGAGTTSNTNTQGLHGSSPFHHNMGVSSPWAYKYRGTRDVPYQKTVEREQTSTSGMAGMINVMTITAMPQYQNKSLEELRWEDHDCERVVCQPFHDSLRSMEELRWEAYQARTQATHTTHAAAPSSTNATTSAPASTTIPSTTGSHSVPPTAAPTHGASASGSHTGPAPPSTGAAAPVPRQPTFTFGTAANPIVVPMPVYGLREFIPVSIPSTGVSGTGVSVVQGSQGAGGPSNTVNTKQ